MNQVANYLSNANALVLFSRYENLPCVILESFCCGLPVICTNVGGVAELITDANGILIASEDEQALHVAMKNMVDHYNSYNSEHISSMAKDAFSYEAVGRKINNVYEEILNN